MSMVNAFDPMSVDMLDADVAAAVARRARVLGPAYRLFYEQPVEIVRSQGCWLYGRHGEPYLDVYNNVACVGHCHPHVVAAIARQAAILNTHTRYLTQGVLDYAERLLATMPDTLGHMMFTCTGSEASDLALRIARAATGGTGVVVTQTAYHGVTAAVSEFSPSLGAGVPIGDHVRLVGPPDGYRGGADIGAAFADDVARAMASLRANGIKPAMMIVDTIFSSDGVFADPPGFLKPAVAAARAAGALVVADEVQAGFGRTGAGMWGFARHDIVPDMVTMGKPMGNGHPIAGVAVSPALIADFGARARYFNTFGGNPVSVAAGMAVLDVLEDQQLIAHAAAMGRHLTAGLQQLAERHPMIGDIRGAGLFIGLDIVADRATRAPDGARAARIVNGLRARRVLISASGPHGNVLKIRPPLVFAEPEAALFLDALDQTLTDITS